MSGDVIDKGQVIMTVEGMKMEVCYGCGHGIY